jgi:transcriptional regulator with XRE-family HTH domain
MFVFLGNDWKHTRLAASCQTRLQGILAFSTTMSDKDKCSREARMADALARPRRTNWGVRIRALRVARGLSQEAAAVRFGFVHRQTLAEVEAGRRELTADEMVRVLEAFDLTFDDAFEPLDATPEARFLWLLESQADESGLRAAERRVGVLAGAWRAFVGGPDLRPTRTLVPRLSAARMTSAPPVGSVRDLAADAELDLGVPVFCIPFDIPAYGVACLLEDMGVVAVPAGLTVELRYVAVERVLSRIDAHRSGKRIAPGRTCEIQDTPQLKSSRFVRVTIPVSDEATRPLCVANETLLRATSAAVAEGFLSARKAAVVMGMALDDLFEEYRARGLPVPGI